MVTARNIGIPAVALCLDNILTINKKYATIKMVLQYTLYLIFIQRLCLLFPIVLELCGFEGVLSGE